MTTISEVSNCLGFENANYFSFWFKRIAGSSPLSYRQSHNSDSESIIAGILTPLTGSFSYIGQDLLLAVRFALDEADENIRRRVQFVPIDTGSDPQLAAERLKKAICSQGICYFVGCLSSAVFLGIVDIISDTQSILLTSCAVDNPRRQGCNSVFRWGLTSADALDCTIRPFIKNMASYI